MNTEMQRRALAARDAHQALLDLKRFIDEAARTTHDVELEAIHLAISTRTTGDIYSKMRTVLDRLGSTDFEASLHRARQSLLMAMS
jgi:hypothetical protein